MSSKFVNTILASTICVALVGSLPARAQIGPTMKLDEEVDVWKVGESEVIRAGIHDGVFTQSMQLPFGQCTRLPNFAQVPRVMATGNNIGETGSNIVDILTFGTTVDGGVMKAIGTTVLPKVIGPVLKTPLGYAGIARDYVNGDIVGMTSSTVGVVSGTFLAYQGAKAGSRLLGGREGSFIGGALGTSVGALGGAIVGAQTSNYLASGTDQLLDYAVSKSSRGFRDGLTTVENAVRGFNGREIANITHANVEGEWSREAVSHLRHENKDIQAIIDYYKIEEIPWIAAHRPERSAPELWIWESERLAVALSKLEVGCDRNKSMPGIEDLEQELYRLIARAKIEACRTARAQGTMDEMIRIYDGQFFSSCRE